MVLFSWADGQVQHERSGIVLNDSTSEDPVYWLQGDDVLVKFPNRYILTSALPNTSLEPLKKWPRINGAGSANAATERRSQCTSISSFTYLK